MSGKSDSRRTSNGPAKYVNVLDRIRDVQEAVRDELRRQGREDGLSEDEIDAILENKYDNR